MYDFIVNPLSRSGQGHSIWKTVETELKKENITYEVHFTAHRRHATSIAEEITKDGKEHTLIVLGGDGTINEVINGIKYLDKCTLGYVPTGSSNDFSRGLGLPCDIKKAVTSVLHSGHSKLIDIGTIRYINKKRRFAVSSGIGYDAAICHTVCISKLKVFLNKIKLGKLAYVGVSLDRLYHCRPAGMTVRLDSGQEFHYKRAYFAAAMNLPYEGGGCKFCPGAFCDDGLLDLIVIADVPKYRALAILPVVFSGGHTHMKGVHIVKCREAQIVSDNPLPIHTDGEPVFLQRKLTMALEPERLKIIIP